MATAEITDRSVYATYKNGSALATTASDYRYIGYSNSSGTYKYSTCYKFVLPTVDGEITAVNLKPYLNNPNSGNLVTPKKWNIGISIGTTNTSYASGVYSTTGTYTKTFSLPITLSSGQDITLSEISFTEANASSFNSGTVLYIYVYAGQTGVSQAKITSLTGTVTYTPATYSAVKQTCTYADASASPSSGVYNTPITFTATSYVNDDTYIYGDIKLYVTPQGIPYSSTPSASSSGYAIGFGASKSTSLTWGMSEDGYYYKATASRYTANPGDASCFASDITSSSARINVVAGITTTFLNANYYLTATDGGEVASTLANAATFARATTQETSYINLTGLNSSASYTRHIYAYNSYNARYYKIGSVSFTTDASSYSATISASNIGVSSATISISSLNSSTNLNGNWYLSTTNSTSTTSLSSPLSAARTSSISMTGLSASTSYTRYAYVYSNASGKYYKVGSVTFRTLDPVSSYSATISGSVTGANTATVSMSNLSSTSGLNGYWYLSTTNSSTATSLSNVTSAAINSSMTVSNLGIASSNTRHAYVLHSNGTYYQVGSITLKTHSYVYYGASLTPCWTYLGQPDGSLKQVVIYPGEI